MLSHHIYLQELHLYVLFLLPEKTPHIKAEPTLLAALIFSTLWDLQLGHLMEVFIGLPQLGQLSASEEICLLQSGQVTSGIYVVW